MIKTFLRNSFIYTIGTILTRGIGIILIPIYTRYLTPGEYGVIDLFLILTSFISLTIALEIHQAVVRFYQNTDDEDEKMQYVSSAFMFSIFVYSLYFAVSYLFSDIFTLLILDDIKYRNIFLLASGAIATGGLFYFTSGQLRWQILPKQSVIVSILHVLVVAFIAVYLLIIKDMKVESIFIGQIVGNLVGIFLSIYFVKKSYKAVFVYEKFKEMVSFSYPLVFSGVAIFVALYVDRIAIKELRGLEELGIYGVAYRFAAVASLVMIGFQSSLSPLIYKHHKEEKTAKNIARLFDGFVVFALLVVGGSILFSKEVVMLMSTQSYYGAAPLIPLLVASVLFSNMYIFAPGLGIAKKTKTLASISIFGAGLNTILNFTLIPIFGLYGAAFATLSSAIMVFILYVLIAYKYYPIPYKTKNLSIAFVFVLSSGYGVLNMFSEITAMTITIKVFCFLGVEVVVILLLIEKEYLKKIHLRIKKII